MFYGGWQTNEKGALPPPTDLECGVYIDLEEKNKCCLARRPHFRGVMGEERQLKVFHLFYVFVVVVYPLDVNVNIIIIAIIYVSLKR